MKDFSVFSFQFSVVLAFMKIYLGQNPGQKCFYIVFSFLSRKITVSLRIIELEDEL